MPITVKFKSMDGVECGSLTTSSSVIVLNKNTLLLDGGVRINISFDIGIVYDDDENVIFIDPNYAYKNYKLDEVVTNYINELRYKV